ncbi:MAG: ABC transporter ATP-binding protein [Pseudomonadota bacterium]
MDSIIQIEGVSLSFGAVRALDGVSCALNERELLAIIGPNGAGKTALVNCINGFYRPQQGRILFRGRDLTKIQPHRIAQMGIARTFQNLALYNGASAIENILGGRHFHAKENLLSQMLWFGPTRREEIRQLKVVDEIIDLLEIQHIRYETVGSLPYGIRKRIELARALAMEPRVLIVDEPMAGMNLEEKEDMARFLMDVYQLRDISIILIEHDMGLVMDIADRIVVLDFGEKIAEGFPKEIMGNPKVIKAYLGESE